MHRFSPCQQYLGLLGSNLELFEALRESPHTDVRHRLFFSSQPKIHVRASEYILHVLQSQQTIHCCRNVYLHISKEFKLLKKLSAFSLFIAQNTAMSSHNMDYREKGVLGHSKLFVAVRFASCTALIQSRNRQMLAILCGKY